MSPRYPRIGVTIALLGSLILSLFAPSAAFGQDADVTAADIVPPVIAPSQNLLAAAENASGVVVTYLIPAANDATDGAVPVKCVPASGTVFPLGETVVKCTAIDAAGNQAKITFTVTVTDQTPPVVSLPADVVVDAADASGIVVTYAVPAATDNVDSPVAVACDPAPGAFFSIGTTVVTCWAQDAAGNVAVPVAFSVTVNAPPPPPPTELPAPTEEPTATEKPEATETPPPTVTPTSTDESPVAQTPTPTKQNTPTPAATKTPTSTPEKSTSPTPTPTATALELPWPPPGMFTFVTDGGPLGSLTTIWSNQDFPITQEFGHTAFSVSHYRWYSYGRAYGLDGFEHTGIDIGMPAGTWIYSPVNGTVKVAGGVPFFKFYGNWQPGVGELLIETDDGNQVILGHMGRIAVQVGQRVEAGQFVGLSGGQNGDHLHLETRELQPGGWYMLVDPRQSFLIPAIEEAAKADATPEAATPEAEE